MTTRTLDPSITEKWETGEYGRSDEHVGVAPREESMQLDSDLAMKLVSIRLPIPLIEALKKIAAHHAIAYQPMIRDLLFRFADSEIKQIVQEIEAKMKSAHDQEEASPPVESFMRRAACG